MGVALFLFLMFVVWAFWWEHGMPGLIASGAGVVISSPMWVLLLLDDLVGLSFDAPGPVPNGWSAAEEARKQRKRARWKACVRAITRR